MAPLSAAGAVWWHPLRCGGGQVPLPLLLSAKLVLLTHFLKNYLTYLPDRHTAFVPLLERLGTPEQFETFLLWLILLASPFLVFNLRPRAGCLVIGLACLTAILGSRPHFAYSRLYGTCWLILVGLYEAPLGNVALRTQVVLLYFGAGLNKLLDADWLNGQYFESWMHDKLANRAYIAAAAGLPELWLSKFMGWFTVASELGMASALAGGFARLAVALGVVFHGGALLLIGEDFGAFFSSVLISYLAFFNWPDSVVVRLPEGWERIGAWLRRVDLEGQLEFHPNPASRFELDVDGVGSQGIAALQTLILVNPISYFVFFALLTASATEAARSAIFVAGGLLLVPWTVRRGLKRARGHPPAP